MSWDIIELWGGTGWLACVALTIFRPKNCSIISRSNGLEPNLRLAMFGAGEVQGLRKLFYMFDSYTDGIGFRKADALTVVSQYEEDFAKQKSYQTSGTLLRIDNPLPADWLKQPERQNNNEFTIGFIGSWIERKGNRLLIDIINSLKSKGSKCKWSIAGVGDNGKRELIKQTGLASDQIQAHASREELKHLYSGMTIFLCLSYYESFGLVSSEAMSCGCILVSTKVGLAAGLVENQEYIRIDSANIDSATNKLLNIENDLNSYSKIGKAGQERVQALEWPAAVDSLEMFYNELISKQTYKKPGT